VEEILSACFVPAGGGGGDGGRWKVGGTRVQAGGGLVAIDLVEGAVQESEVGVDERGLLAKSVRVSRAASS
jgi:hypothetical protein